VVPFAAGDDGPVADWADGVTLHPYELADGAERVTTLPAPDGSGPAVTFTTHCTADAIVIETDSGKPWNVLVAGGVPEGQGAADPLGARYTCPAGTPRLVIRRRVSPGNGGSDLHVQLSPLISTDHRP
jgi:alpha-D-xyloside xylohydrolase